MRHRRAGCPLGRSGPRVWWWSLLVVVLARGAAAQEAPGVQSLSLTEALERARRAGPEVLLARREIAEAMALRTGAALVMPSNPLLSGYLAGYDDQGQADVSAGLRLEQAVEIGGQRAARLREVDRIVEASRQRAGAAVTALLAAVAEAYARAGSGLERVEFARQGVAIADRLLAAARLRVQSGAASDIEVALAETERGRAGITLLDAERELRAALATLRQYLDLPPGTALALTTRVGRLGLPGNVEELVTRARERRRDLRALRAERAVVEATDDRLRREAIPSPTVGAVYDRGPQSPPVFGVALGISLPLFRRNQGERAVAAARGESLSTAIRLLERRVEREVRAAGEEYGARAREVEVFETEILPSAQRALDLVEAGWLAGRFDLFRVLASSRELTEARRDYVAMVGNLWQAYARMRAVTGEE